MIGGRKITTILLIIAGVIANTVPRWVHGWVICGRKVYYIGDALSFVLIMLAGMMYVKDKTIRVVFEFALILAVSNLSDEVVGDPLSFGNNEKVFGIIITACTLYRIKKCLNKPPIPQS